MPVRRKPGKEFFEVVVSSICFERFEKCAYMHNGNDTDDDDTTISDDDSASSDSSNTKTNVPDANSINKLPFAKSDITKIVAVVGKPPTPER
jgi:hypothetical protein